MLLTDYFTFTVYLRNGKEIKEAEPGEPPAFKFEDKNPEFSQIERFVLDSKLEEKQSFEVIVPEGARLIYFRRIIMNTGNEFPKFGIYLLGVQRTKKGRNEREIIFIFPDGKTELCFGDEPRYMKTFLQKLKILRQNHEI